MYYGRSRKLQYLNLTEFRFPSELGSFRRVPPPLEPTRLFFQLALNLTFSPSSPPPLLFSYPFPYLYIKMADVKKGKSPKEFAGMLLSLCLVLQSR
jgi:hypothetical protein